jgi:hypothetical protein
MCERSVPRWPPPLLFYSLGVPVPGVNFDYVFVVPDEAPGPLHVWQAQVRTPIKINPDYPEWSKTLAGHAPMVRLEYVDPAVGHCHTRISFETYRGDPTATRTRFSFNVDRQLTKMLRPGDHVYASGSSAKVAFSVVRGDRLVAAAGALAGAYLGPSVQVFLSGELGDEAAKVFRRVDPTYQMTELPLDITVGAHRRILHSGRLTLDGYEIVVANGGQPGDESVSIELRGVCPDCAAVASLRVIRVLTIEKGTDNFFGPT